ncbi:hypothetical protein E1281_33290 [Actinomadura sp. KC345]|uniref:hypothetical protein n=1 Tax=Actinomadura sp. KC345 TaxID=2530371 RepID=UPI001047BD7E|nr:hypothetical protein [Actinomadura sp. KC345]TDC44621.1 hypothetical protein E1281_33290 [Actinomadura sp. KC345]
MTSWKTRIGATAGLGLAAGVSAFALTTGPALAQEAQSAPQAAAADCSGTLIDRKVAKYDGKPVAELVVYYKDGRNCARLNHLGVTRGKSLRTTVYLAACKETSPGPRCTPVRWPSTEDDDFKYYAGPVYQNARNRCIHAAGDIYFHGKRHLETSPIASHCG